MDPKLTDRSKVLEANEWMKLLGQKYFGIIKGRSAHVKRDHVAVGILWGRLPWRESASGGFLA